MFFRNNLKETLTIIIIDDIPYNNILFSGIKPHINIDYTPKHKDHGKFLALIQTKKKKGAQESRPGMPQWPSCRQAATKVKQTGSGLPNGAGVNHKFGANQRGFEFTVNI